LEAHKKYGEIIRLAPDELSYVQSTAWKEIYGHRAPGEPEFPKDPKHNAETVVENILNSGQEYHAVLRRLLAHGFSEKALRSQEEILQEYSDIMVDKIGKSGNGKEAVVDIVSWYNVSHKGNRLTCR
jgi:cytochrome P450